MIELATVWTPAFQQLAFRCLLEAMARPGMVQTLPQLNGSPSSLAVLATLLDAEVSLADPNELLQPDSWGFLQAKQVSAQQADFVLCRGSAAPNFSPKPGTLSSPEHSATLILEIDSVAQGSLHLNLTGPGVKGRQQCQLYGLHDDWLHQRNSWISDFPLGVDMFLVDSTSVIAIPRTTTVEVC